MQNKCQREKEEKKEFQLQEYKRVRHAQVNKTICKKIKLKIKSSMFLYVTVELVPKDIPSNDFEYSAIFVLKDAREGDDLIFTGRAFHVMLARSVKELLSPF